jgi:molybdenum cofactor guanylyltransferase
MEVDLVPGKSSLGGIYTGLAYTNTVYNLVVGCDMPFLNHALISYLVQNAPGYDAIVPRIGKFLEPLHAVYTKNCIATVEKLIEENSLSVNRIFKYVKTRYVDKDEVDLFDPDHLSFFNVNTENDFLDAERISRQFNESKIMKQVTADDKC